MFCVSAFSPGPVAFALFGKATYAARFIFSRFYTPIKQVIHTAWRGEAEAGSECKEKRAENLGHVGLEALPAPPARDSSAKPRVRSQNTPQNILFAPLQFRTGVQALQTTAD